MFVEPITDGFAIDAVVSGDALDLAVESEKELAEFVGIGLEDLGVDCFAASSVDLSLDCRLSREPFLEGARRDLRATRDERDIAARLSDERTNASDVEAI